MARLGTYEVSYYSEMTDHNSDSLYFEKAKNGFMSNFSKIDSLGRSYACYQPDYITGGGFTDRCEDVNFRIVNGFPKQTDSGLSRYVWSRAAGSIFENDDADKIF